MVSKEANDENENENENENEEQGKPHKILTLSHDSYFHDNSNVSNTTNSSLSENININIDKAGPINPGAIETEI